MSEQLNDRCADIGAIYKGTDERDGKEHYFVVDHPKNGGAEGGWPPVPRGAIVLRCLTDSKFDEGHSGRAGCNAFFIDEIKDDGLTAHAKRDDGGVSWASGGFAHCRYEHCPDLTLESVQALISE